MPNYIAMKEYFRKIVLFGEGKKKRIQTFYITPSKQHPYEYDHPEGTGHQVSPFVSVWFVGLSYTDNEAIKSTNQVVIDAFTKFHTSGSKSGSTPSAPQIVLSLQNLIRIEGVSAEKRKNPRQRKKMKQQAMQKAAAAAVGNESTVNYSSSQQQAKRKPDGNSKKDKRKKNKKRKIR